MAGPINPFESSRVDGAGQLRPPFAGARRVRPYSPLMIGIVACVIGGVGFLNSIMYFVNLHSGSLELANVPHYDYATLFIHSWTPHVDRGVRGVLAPMLFFGGLGIANYCEWGRMWLVRYSAFSIVATLFLTAYLIVSLLQEIPFPYLEWKFVAYSLAQLLRILFPMGILLLLFWPRLKASLD